MCWLWRRPKLSVRGRGTKRSLILATALDYAKKGLDAVLTHIPAASDLSAGGATALSVAIVALVCFLAGLVARTVTAQRVVDALESSVLSKIPAYEYLKREGASALGVAETATLPVVFVPMEGGRQLGVQTDALSNGPVSIFVPGARTLTPGRSFSFRRAPSALPASSWSTATLLRHVARRRAASSVAALMPGLAPKILPIV